MRRGTTPAETQGESLQVHSPSTRPYSAASDTSANTPPTLNRYVEHQYIFPPELNRAFHTYFFFSSCKLIRRISKPSHTGATRPPSRPALFSSTRTDTSAAAAPSPRLRGPRTRECSPPAASTGMGESSPVLLLRRKAGPHLRAAARASTAVRSPTTAVSALWPGPPLLSPAFPMGTRRREPLLPPPPPPPPPPGLREHVLGRIVTAQQSQSALSTRCAASKTLLWTRRARGLSLTVGALLRPMRAHRAAEKGMCFCRLRVAAMVCVCGSL